MKFKNLLLERSDEELAEKLDSLLGGEFRNGSRTLLYRGTDRGVNWFKVLKIQGDRKPIGGRYYIQKLVDIFSEYREGNIPKRADSKFASTDKAEAGFFGQNLIIVFPSVDANVVSFEHDTLKYRKRVDRALDSLQVHHMERLEKYEHFHEFLKKSKDVEKTRIDPEEYKQFIKNNWSDIIKDRQKIYRNDDFLDKLKERVREIFEGLHDYFDYMSEGIHPDSEEVMFDGDEYLAVNVSFFNEYFEWDGSEWTLK